MSEQDMMTGLTPRPAPPQGSSDPLNMESPTVANGVDPAIPDRQPTPGTHAAMDIPETRMAIRNETRSNRFIQKRDSLITEDNSLIF